MSLLYSCPPKVPGALRPTLNAQKMVKELTRKMNVCAPTNVFLLTSLTMVKVWRRHTLPEIVSWNVPDITFTMGKCKMLIETKVAKMIQCSFFSSWVLGRPLRTRPRSEYMREMQNVWHTWKACACFFQTKIFEVFRLFRAYFGQFTPLLCANFFWHKNCACAIDDINHYRHSWW